MTLFSRIPAVAALGVVTSLGVLPAGAHHSTAAFDNSRVIKIEGTIKQFRWINPHASIKIDGVTAGHDPAGVDRCAVRVAGRVSQRGVGE